MQDNQKDARGGFTILELLLVIAVAGVAVAVFFGQKYQADAISRDTQRKIAINAMYYNLEEVFYAKNKYYPETVSESNLTAMDPQLFTDPSGINIGLGASSYRYEPTDCTSDGKCAHYTLRAILEKESEFIKNSKN